ncbi:MAG: cytochrome d ubiquinol oxidase subunit II [Gammaproteobacteria bacterium]|nr:cytochrome d ubiquinol oxidase subunit II [Gammaproteobacteria bacterium]
MLPIDYETLRLIWWLLLGILLIGFAVMGGFDLGVAMCMPLIARSDAEKRILINSIGPTWEGNQVWFVLGGGAIFAAWPPLYAIAFSGFYFAMLLVLLALILRPVGFKYRSKLSSPLWRRCWDIALWVGGFVPSLVFGVAVGNVLQGVPFYFNLSLRPFYTGTFLELLNPFALLTGVLSVLMLLMHGACFIQLKTEHPLKNRAQRVSGLASGLTLCLFLAAGAWLMLGYLPGYQLTSLLATDGPSNPLHKTVIVTPMAWLQNYHLYPWTILAPLLASISLLIVSLCKKWVKTAFCFSALGVACIIATVGLSMYPFILPSSTHPHHSLMIWDASSSHMTLFVMLVATVIFLPIILLYTAWVYRVLRGTLSEEFIQHHEHELY